MAVLLPDSKFRNEVMMFLDIGQKLSATYEAIVSLSLSKTFF